MARHTAIAAAELRVAQARRELRDDLRRLQRSLSGPSYLAAAALFGFWLGRRDGAGTAAGMLATTLIRRGVAFALRSTTADSQP
jgi:hypothetical protein